MLKIVLSTIPLILISGCGSDEKSSTSTTPVVEEASLQENSQPVHLSKTQKLNQATKELNFKLISFKNELNIISREESISFKGDAYILKNIDEKKALISLGLSELENFEKKESLVINTNISQLPTLEHGYRNILIETETTIDNIKLELEDIFNKQGSSILSYNLNDIEKNATIMITGDNTIYTCTNKTTDDIFEIRTDDNSYLSLPSDIAGHYVCFDQKENKVFDYNLTFESTDIFGVKYTFNPNISEGAPIDIYNIISTQIDIKSLEESLERSKEGKADISLVLRVFYKKLLDKEGIKKEVFQEEVTILSAGKYDIFYTLTSPQNTSINIDRQIQVPLIIEEKVLAPKLIPN